MRSDIANLKRAWKHLLKKGLFSNKKRAAIVLCLGVLTTLIQMSAVILLVGAARAYDNGGVLEYAQLSLDLREGNGLARLIYICVTAALLILSIIAAVGNKLIITNIGRKFFEESLSEMREQVFDNVIDGRAFDRADTIKILNRDCRYLSLSYLRVLTLLQPALLLIGIFAIAIYLVPIAAMFLAVAGLIVLPFNIYLVLWAARTSQDIQDAAKVKSAEEKDFIAHVAKHPMIHKLSRDNILSHERPGEVGFLTAFVKRQRMSAYSQSITDLMMALVVVALALFLFLGGGNTLLLNLSNIVILVILFRFMTGYISQVAQTVTMVSSYEPFFRTLLDLKLGNHKSAAKSVNINELRTPLRLAVFQNLATDWSNLENIKTAFGIKNGLQFVSSDYNISTDELRIWIDDRQMNFDTFPEENKNECEAFLLNNQPELSDATKLLLALSNYNKEEGRGLLLNGRDLTSLDRNLKRIILSAPEDAPLIIVYKNAPRNLVLPPRFQIALRLSGKTTILGDITEFTNLRSAIIDKLSQSMSQVPNEDESDEAADIIV